MESANLKQKYGLLTAICLVVGAVIGSGIFFVNETIFGRVGGNLTQAVIAWLIGGAIMFVMMWVWGQLAGDKAGMGGLLEYTDDLLGKTYSYFLGWFLGTILYPAFVAVLAWVTARFTAQLLGWDLPFTGGPTWMLAGVYMVGIYIMNVISPKLAGFFQVSTTFIKVVPLILMGVVGIIFGLTSGQAAENVNVTVEYGTAMWVSNPLFYAILSTVFAYAGSEEVLMMSSEIKDRKKNLPRAIVIGSIIIIAIYVLYTVGVFGAMNLVEGTGITAAFNNVFGSAMGNILIVFIIISCLGAMNSAMMAGSRVFYALAIRGKGPNPEAVKQVDRYTDMPPTSAALSLLFCGIIFFIVFANAQETFVLAEGGYFVHTRWFGSVNFAVSSLAPVSLMALYIPVFVAVMIKQTNWNVFNRFIMPALSVIGALTLIYMVFYTNATGAWWYLAFFGVIMGIAALFLLNNNKQNH